MTATDQASAHNYRRSLNHSFAGPLGKDQGNNRHISEVNCQTNQAYWWLLQPEELQDTVPITESVSEKPRHNQIIACRWPYDKKKSLSNIPQAFIRKLQPLQKYWEKFDKNQQLQVFESKGSLFYHEISKITDEWPLSWDEFVSYCWQYHTLDEIRPIDVLVKRITRRGNPKSYVNHRKPVEIQLLIIFNRSFV